MLYQKLIYFSIAVFVFFSPFSIAGTQAGWVLGIIVWIYGLIKKQSKIEKTEINYLVIIFLIITIVSSLVSVIRISGFNLTTLKNTITLFFTSKENVMFSFKSLKGELLITIFFLISSNLDKDKYKKLLNVFFIVLSITSILGIIKYFLYNEERLNGIMGFYMTYGNYLGISSLVFLPFTLKLENPKRIKYLICYIPIMVALILTLTRGAWISFFIGLLIFFFIENKKLFYLTIFFILLIVANFLIFAPDSKISKRITGRYMPKDYKEARPDIWKTAINMSLHYPVLGVGLDNYKNEAHNFWPPNALPPEAAAGYCHAHDNILQIASERGIPALIVFLLIFYFILKVNYQNYKYENDLFFKYLSLGIFLSIICFLLEGVTEYNFGDSEIIMLVWFLSGLTFQIRRNTNQAQ